MAGKPYAFLSSSRGETAAGSESKHPSPDKTHTEDADDHLARSSGDLVGR